MGVLVVMFDGEREIGGKTWQDTMTLEAVKREKLQSKKSHLQGLALQFDSGQFFLVAGIIFSFNEKAVLSHGAFPLFHGIQGHQHSLRLSLLARFRWHR